MSSTPALHVQQLPSSTHLLPLPSHPVTQTQRSISIPGSGPPAQLHGNSLSQQLAPMSNTPAPHVQQVPPFTPLLPVPSQAIVTTQQSRSASSFTMPKTTGNEPPFEVKVLSFLSKIVGNLDQVKIEVNVLKRKVDNLSTSTQENEPLATVEIPLLPVKTIDELKLYEEVLTKDLDQFFKMVLKNTISNYFLCSWLIVMILFQVRFVKQIGGLTLSDCVKRAWESVITLEVRVFVNWNGKPRTGQPQKYGLKKSKVTEAVFSRLFYIKIFIFLSHVLITFIEGIAFKNASLSALEFETKKAKKPVR
ncbi:Uncharacterized protein APZ42_008174, partial [Daphnia magna]